VAKQQPTGNNWKVRLLEIIEKSGRTQKDISVEAGLGRAYLYGVCREGKEPSVENFLAICKALNVSPAFVLFGWNITEKQQELLRLLGSSDDKTEAVLTLLR